MGKKVIVHYEPEGNPTRQFETTVPRILFICGIFVACLAYTLIAIGKGVLSSYQSFASLQGTATASLINQRISTNSPTPPVNETIDRNQESLNDVDTNKNFASLDASDRFIVDIEIPTPTAPLEIDGLQIEEDSINLFVHYKITNKADEYARGYTYGLAVFTDSEGNESLIPSHPGIDAERPFARERLVTALSYGARRFTNKTLSFDRPNKLGKFGKVWVVASLAGDLQISELDL